MDNTHILNGDALRERFPKKIPGELIILRECLIEGPVKERDRNAFFNNRSYYLRRNYPGEAYGTYVLPELQRIIQLPDGGDVTLWFEEDLFCQVNLWFTCSLLYEKKASIFLAMPEDELEMGFGGLSTSELVSCFTRRKPLTPIHVNQFALLWFAYSSDNIERMLKLGVQMCTHFPFIMQVIKAHIDSIPSGKNPGLPTSIVLQMLKENPTADFAEVFEKFRKRVPIYGFGDLQVKKIFNEVLDSFEVNGKG